MTEPTYRYKPDWETARRRWDAFWSREATDRPCMTIYAPRPEGKVVPLPEVSFEDMWMDAGYQVATAHNFLESTHFRAEAVPRFVAAGGALMAVTTTGCRDFQFHGSGISLRPAMSSVDEPLNWRPGPQDPWRAKVDAICMRMLDAARGACIVPTPWQYNHIDLLNMLVGNERLMLALAVQPESAKARLREMRPLAAENDRHFAELIKTRQPRDGQTCWTGVWSRREFRCATACSAVCISPGMFEEVVLPELDAQGERFEQVHFHTCGYKQHLEACLTRPYIKVIEYSPGPKEQGMGPDLLAFYRRVQEAGRCLDISAVPDQLELLLRHLRPEGLHIRMYVRSIEDADETVANAVKWSGRDIHATGSV